MKMTDGPRPLSGKLCFCAVVLACLALAGVLWVFFGRASGKGREINAEGQERVAELLQNVLGVYRGESGVTSGSNSLSITYTNIEASFREASRLMPNRLDLRFGIASALVGQALQTNTQFEAKMKSALKVYEEIEALDKKAFQAPILFAAYTRAMGESDASAAAIGRLMAVYPERTRAYLQKFQRVDEEMKLRPNESAEKVEATGREQAIVVLGAGLGTNGVMKAKLVARLKQALLLAKANPEAAIVVTGGNPRSGITEAYAMGLWLTNEGIPAERLYLEDRATDTVGNAIRTCAILKKLGVTQVTLVTSASHLHRALADFEEAAFDRGLYLKFSHLASKDEKDLDEARERIAVYRDVMRTSGIWAFPGIQR